MNIGISVVIPSYNCLKYLPDALESVWQQSCPADEVWVIDDGSNDGTLEYLQQQQLLHPMLQVLRLEQVGVANARNAAMALCQHDYVAFLDADDRWLPDKLLEQRQLLRRHRDCILLFGNYLHVGEDGNAICDCFDFWPRFRQRAMQLHQPLDKATVLMENVIGTSTVVIQRQLALALGGFDNRLGSASDWDLWLKLAAVGSVWAQPQLQMHYLMRRGSISSNRLARLHAMQQIIQRHCDQAISTATRHGAEANLALGFAEYHQQQQHYLTAFGYQLKSAYLAPKHTSLKTLLSPFAGWLHHCVQQRQYLEGEVAQSK
ncbi:glycosyltransferase family 2 protein [Ferrimonas senticii]|uniref:glycosyltransferase family 2 protein n=1 Tax=Ferrimonas senticii TaxID=394566 RepID=UPI0003F6DCBB|nr:glycosyltransferase family 2 protein [Ferrimonas senticii]